MIPIKKIITLTGHKHTKKDIVAEKLAKNSDVAFIKPYTDKEKKSYILDEYVGGYHHMSKEELDYMIRNEEVLCKTKIGDARYVFFKSQLTAPYNVLIVDDYAVVEIKDNWKGSIYTIRLVSDNEEESDRVGEYLYKHEFDLIFDYYKDDFDELEAKIV